MKDKVNRFIDWFESKFNSLIDITALIGAIFTIGLSIFIFFALIGDSTELVNVLDYVALPGVLGFFSIIMLFALRITRHLTKNS